MAILYETSRNENGGSLKRGSFKKIHDTVLNSLGIHDKGLLISVHCIKIRVLRNSLTVDAQCNQKSPMAQIEPVLLQISLWKQDAGQPITPTEGLCLANLLIDGKPMQDQLKMLQAQKRQLRLGYYLKNIGINF